MMQELQFDEITTRPFGTLSISAITGRFYTVYIDLLEVMPVR